MENLLELISFPNNSNVLSENIIESRYYKAITEIT